MTALYIILAVVAVIMLLLLIPADCILEFSYNNKENNGSVIIKYVFLKFKIFPNDKVEEEVENEEETTDKEEKKEKRGSSLTVTECEILKLMALGKTTKEIAAERFLSVYTVMTHRKNIFRKLEVNNVYEATKYALRAGIVDAVEYYI